MKAAAFDYVRPASLKEVCGYLADESLDVRIIAGGQSLVPMMAMRLVRPELLVDINDVDSLAGIARDGGEVVIGAATRQAEAERNALVGKALPLLSLALPFIGHDQTRNRGTVGGSLAHADPSAEIGLVAATLDAAIIATDGARERRIVAAAAQLALDADGICRRAAVALANAAPTPVRLTQVEAALVSTRPTEDAIAKLLSLVDAAIDPSGDLHAGADARRHMARSLTSRAILQAARNAGGSA